ARATADKVTPGAAGQRVVAVAADDARRRQGAVGLVQGEVVVAAPAVDHDQARVGDGRWSPLNRDGAAVDEDRPGRVAGDHDGVVLRIAANGQPPVYGGERGRDRRRGGVQQHADGVAVRLAHDQVRAAVAVEVTSRRAAIIAKAARE